MRTVFIPINGTFIATAPKTTTDALIKSYVSAEQRKARALGTTCEVTHDGLQVVVDGTEVSGAVVVGRESRVQVGVVQRRERVKEQW